MIAPDLLNEERLLVLRAEALRLALTCATALNATEPNASVARVLVCTIGARIAELLGIRSERAPDAPAAELVDVASSDAAETIDMDPEDA